jgi:GlcNAc-P-P-Und epimerase
MYRALVTGGSGFIGTALLVSLRRAGYELLSVDIEPPQNEEHRDIYRAVDILDGGLLVKTVRNFQPTHVVHMAARADLDGKSVEDYKANTAGVQNVIDAVAEVESIQKVIFASTKLVCAGGYRPKSDVDYCPNTRYGESKVDGEYLVRNSTSLRCPWCIVRPTSIWGPWFDVPYRGLFMAVAKGYYFHVGGCNPQRNFGYVGNVVHQLEMLLVAPAEKIHGRTFYLTDYEDFTTREWADAISSHLKSRRVPTVPGFVLQCAARCGDVLKKLGWNNPPMTSFRLNNMRIDTSGLPLESIKEITGPQLPYTMEQGVAETIAWMRGRGLIRGRYSKQ